MEGMTFWWEWGSVHDSKERSMYEDRNPEVYIKENARALQIIGTF